MPNCTCGNFNSEGSRYCSGCGKKLVIPLEERVEVLERTINEYRIIQTKYIEIKGARDLGSGSSVVWGNNIPHINQGHLIFDTSFQPKLGNKISISAYVNFGSDRAGADNLALVLFINDIAEKVAACILSTAGRTVNLHLRHIISLDSGIPSEPIKIQIRGAGNTDARVWIKCRKY